MMVDITLSIAPKLSSGDTAPLGHIGTHFDVMDKEFPLEYTQRRGIVFNVSAVHGRDIELSDIDIERVEDGMFAAFYTGFGDNNPYGTQAYFHEHPQLSHELIDALIKKGVSIIGIDFAGVRRGKEHTPADKLCADNGVFIVENLCDLNALLGLKGGFTVRTFPMRWAGLTGLPCRVIVEA